MKISNRSAPLILLMMSGGQSSMALANTAEVDKLSLEEVVVTAQRRAENLQDVPVAISALSGSDLEEVGITDLKSIGQRTPSVYFENQTKSRAVVSIRGVGQSSASSVGSSAVGVFVDGVYMPRTSGAIQNLSNIDRVEVLKGPQGTLYGRNTIGGALSIYTQKPGDDFQGRVSTELGNKGSWGAGLNLSGALLEGILSASLDINRKHKGGERFDQATGIEDDSDDRFLRVRTIYTPGEHTEIDVIASFSDEQGDAILEQPKGSPIPFSAIPLPPPAPAGTVVYSVPLAAQLDYLQGASAIYNRSSVSELGLVDIKTQSLSVAVNHEFDSVDLLSLTSYYESDFNTRRDFDGTAFDIIDTDDVSDSKTWAQEFRLASKEDGVLTFNGDLEWLLGAFYLSDDASQNFGVRVGQDAIFSALLNQGKANENNYLSTVDTTAYAVFGQMKYYYGEKLGLTFGLRYSKDYKDYVYQASTDTQFVPVIVQNFSLAGDLSFESLDPRIIIDYQLNDQAMIYASYNQGYKSGGIQFATPSPDAARQTIDKEVLKSYEVGLKSRWLDGRIQMNASAYVYDYKDMVRNGIVIINGAPVSLAANAAGADIEGFEADIEFLATESLFLKASYGYISSEFTEYNFAGKDLTGNELPLTPNNSLYLSAKYEFSISDWESSVILEYNWRDDIFFEEDNNAIGGVGDQVGLFNASLNMRSPNSSIAARLFCQNCSDHRYQAFTTLIGDTGYGVSSLGEGRRIGLSVSYEF